VLAVVALVLVAVGVFRSFYKPQTEAPTIRIVGAGVDILPGARIGFNNLHYLSLPRNYWNKDMIATSDVAVGRVAKVFIPAGEPVMNSSLFNGKDGLSLNFETDERAMTLKLEDDALLDHALEPGDLVDVIVTTASDGKKFTKTVAQKVRVLLTATKEAFLGNRARGSELNRITLAVTPDQAEVLSEAVEVGKLRLVLRNRLSSVSSKLGGVQESDLLPPKALIKDLGKINIAREIPTPPAPPSLMPPSDLAPVLSNEANSMRTPLQWVVDVFSGSKKESYAFPEHSP